MFAQLAVACAFRRTIVRCLLPRLRAMPAADSGMTTAEYAVGTLAACGFGGVLYKVITSPEILGLIRDVIARAFRLSF